MLFVQCITLRYMKDVRYANYANQRRTVKFYKLPDVKLRENEIIFSNVFLYQTTDKIDCSCNGLQSFGSECFYEKGFNNAPFSGRLAIVKDDNSFKIKYCGKYDIGFYGTKIIFQLGEYGRIVFNERGGYDYTGIWYYDLITYNFVNAPIPHFTIKYFSRKNQIMNLLTCSIFDIADLRRVFNEKVQ